MLQKAVCSWVFEPQTSLRRMAEMCAAAGLRGLELALDLKGEINIESPQEECRAALQHFRSCGVSITGVTTNLFWKCHFGCAEADEREMARQIAEALLDRAMWLEAPIAKIIPAIVGQTEPNQPFVSYERAVARSTTELSQLVADAEIRGVKIAVRSVGKRFILSPVEMRQLIDQVNSPAIGVDVNVNAILDYGYPQDWIRTLGHRVLSVTISQHTAPASEAAPAPAGAPGTLNIAEIIAALRDVDYAGAVTYQGVGKLKEIATRLAAFCAAF